MIAQQDLAFVNADIAGFGPGTLRVRGTRILEVGAPAQSADRVIELNGDRLLPGLINAHDHLHRNHYPRLKYRTSYQNASQWAADIDARRRDDALLAACAAVPLVDRLTFGGLKNLLCGATTVAHHDASFSELALPGFPVHVRGAGWAHSLAIDGTERVRESHRATPPDMPWFIHAGEGIDAAAADEITQLETLRVLTPNAVLVHGVAFDQRVHARMIQAGVGLVWCPGSNEFLYGRVAAPGGLARAGLLALGSDARLSGERDLLDELQLARRSGHVCDTKLESLVTTNASRLLRLPDRGRIRAGAVADLLVLPRDAQLWELRRADLRAVIVAGSLRCGDPQYAEQMLDGNSCRDVLLDGRAKCLHAAVADLQRGSSLQEPGLELAHLAVRAALAS